MFYCEKGVVNVFATVFTVSSRVCSKHIILEASSIVGDQSQQTSTFHNPLDVPQMLSRIRKMLEKITFISIGEYRISKREMLGIGNQVSCGGNSKVQSHVTEILFATPKI